MRNEDPQGLSNHRFLLFLTLMSPQAIILINQRLIIVLYIFSHSIYYKKFLESHNYITVTIWYCFRRKKLFQRMCFDLLLNCFHDCRDKNAISHVYFLFTSRIKVVKNLCRCIHLTFTLNDVHFRSGKFKYNTFIKFQRTKCAKYLH